MSVSLPELSSVSWSSFMTGAKAGKHGIFGFVDLEPESYQYRFPNFRDLRVPTFFDLLGERRLYSIIINLPSTYPARKIPGSGDSVGLFVEWQDFCFAARLTLGLSSPADAR